jgi:transposase
MAGKSRLPQLALSAEQLSELQQLSQSRTAPLREVQRARILCRYHAGETIAGIARAMEITRKSVRKWIDKALAMGAEAALKDAYHRARPPVITEEARAWVVHLACSKPKDLGYAAELWTRSLLAQACSARGHASGASFIKPRSQSHGTADPGRTTAASRAYPVLSGKTRSRL